MGVIEVEADSPGIISIGIRDRQGGTTRSMTTMDVGKSGDGRGHWMQRTAETRSDAEWGDTDCKALIATTLTRFPYAVDPIPIKPSQGAYSVSSDSIRGPLTSFGTISNLFDAC
jgi:hypothetical protein